MTVLDFLAEHAQAGGGYRIVVHGTDVDVLLDVPVDPETAAGLRPLLSAARDAGLNVRLRVVRDVVLGEKAPT